MILLLDNVLSIAKEPLGIIINFEWFYVVFMRKS